MNLCKVLFFLLFIFWAASCGSSPETPVEGKAALKITDTIDMLVKKQLDNFYSHKFYTEGERVFIQFGLIDIQSLDSSIKVDLRYSSENNFTGKDIYGRLFRAYLQPEVAKKLATAQLFLKEKHPGHGLLVYDAVRPVSIQKIMWDTIIRSGADKIKYLSNPAYGSLHSYGAAVDLSIVDSMGNELDMGTAFDHFGELSHPVQETRLLSEGRLTTRQVANRQLLRYVMYRAGFFNIETEWWHFNSCTREAAGSKYKIID